MVPRKPSPEPNGGDSEEEAKRHALEEAERLKQMMDEAALPAVKAISDALKSPALDALRNTVEGMKLSLPKPEPLNITFPVPTETRILEAQRDTIEAIEHMRQENATAWGKQIEVLEGQTKLTWWVLVFAVAGVLVGCAAILVGVLIARGG